jgi:hypothetical protein
MHDQNNIKLSTMFIKTSHLMMYMGGADKYLARPTSRCILFDG